jgi:glutamate transport system permease protein
VTAAVLADDLGPRARRRVRIASVAAGIALVGVVALAGQRLADKGQLDAAKWRPFTEGAVLRFFLGGLANTLRAAAVAMGLALVLGVFLALGRLTRNGPVRWAAGAWVELFRAVPLLLLILFAGLGLPKYGIDLPTFWYLVLALVAYNGAVLAEIFRAGILSLDRGQFDAAAALGLTYWQGMFLVIVPQAARRMVPAVLSQLVTLLKDTSLGYVITYEELLRRGRLSGEFYGNLLQSFVFVALVYIVVNFTLSRLAHRLEIRQRRRYKAGSIDVSGIEDLATVAAASSKAG